MHEALSRTLYRTLLRTTKLYTSRKEKGLNSAVLCSLLYRSGSDDHTDFSSLLDPPPVSSITIPSSSSGDDKVTTSDSDRIRLTPDEARDLTKSYVELQEIHAQEDKETLSSIVEETENEPYTMPRHILLYKTLLREVLGPDAHMNFPSKCIPSHTIIHNAKSEDTDVKTSETKVDETSVADRLERIIRREFRPRCTREEGDSSTSSSFDKLPLSWSYTDANRRDTAFLALRELEKKVKWASSIAANAKSQAPTIESVKNERIDTMENKHDDEHTKIPPARGVVPLQTDSPSQYLRSGTYLLAHPLLTGCFEKSVICILEHTEPRYLDTDDDDENHDEGKYDMSSATIGGTYGLMINKPLRVGVPNFNSEKTRNRMLRETIRHDCLPKGIRTAFGDNAVRNGGPVNLSVQMLSLRETNTVERGAELDVDKDIWGIIGGSMLSMNLGKSPDDLTLGGSSGSDSMDEGKVQSLAMDSDSTVHYGGDIIQAAQSVIDGDIETDSFSFVVGASCWEAGQLESEIERGYWLPCTGPPSIAFSGTCETTCDNGEMKVVSERDLWVAMMSALGTNEDEFANLMRNAKFDENGAPCDQL